VVYNNGTLVTLAQGPPARTETSESFNVTAGQTYVIDAYECANGCSSIEGIAGQDSISFNLLDDVKDSQDT
jgi:hypothetical protein